MFFFFDLFKNVIYITKYILLIVKCDMYHIYVWFGVFKM